MILILEEYFKDYPTRLKIIEGLYKRGISIRNGRFYVEDLEIPVSEIAKAFNVNRRTVYETVKAIEDTSAVREIMASIRPRIDRLTMSQKLGNQIFLMTPRIGCFGSLLNRTFDILGNHACNLVEVEGSNVNKKEYGIRLIFQRPVSKAIVEQLSSIPFIDKMKIITPDLESEDVVCNACEVKTCPNKQSSKLEDLEKVP
ncbi:MAG: HTH domain-containing protein [Candidatus Thermoplasmatota archaeon]|jgi:predicted regulator of amino acid metabolism with ACT domain|nr:HTH domain-containing protein [Candidatus Thermoplasmatota archaeon]